MRHFETIEELRQELTRQVLEIALASDNPQYKLDTLRATNPPGRAKPPPEPASITDAMTMFRARVTKAEGSPNGTD